MFKRIIVIKCIAKKLKHISTFEYNIANFAEYLTLFGFCRSIRSEVEICI